MLQIEVYGYKSIKSLNIKLTNINILIGSNGSGKSNFLSFFNFLKQIYNRNLREHTSLKGLDTFLYKGNKVTEEIKAHLRFKGTNGYSFTLKQGNNGFIFVKEGLWYANNPYYKNPIDIATYDNESALRYNTTPRATFIRGYLDQLVKYHFHDTGDNSPFNKDSNVDDDKFYLYETGTNLAAFLFEIKESNMIVYNLIVKTIQTIAPYFLDFFLVPDASKNIRLRWQSKHSSSIYGVSSLSDGTIRFIALAVLFLQPQLPETIIIDEPELGLHPTAITKLSGLIKSAALKGTQIILATQSTDLISHFSPEDIITVDQIGGESHFKRLNSNDLQVWLEDYTVGELWKRNIITTGQPNNS
jgi:predicted ATPase